MVRLLFLLGLLASRAHAVEVVEVGGSPCSVKLLNRHGLSVSKICIDKNEFFVCTSELPPFGLKLSDEDLEELNLDKTASARLVASKCKRKKGASSIKPVTKNCEVSDHSLFKSLLMGLNAPHSCFCDQGPERVLAVCQESGGNWRSTGEFDTAQLKNLLNGICSSKLDSAYQIACFCEKHFGSENSTYIDCLKGQTSTPLPMYRHNNIRNKTGS